MTQNIVKHLRKWKWLEKVKVTWSHLSRTFPQHLVTNPGLSRRPPWLEKRRITISFDTCVYEWQAKKIDRASLHFLDRKNTIMIIIRKTWRDRLSWFPAFRLYRTLRVPPVEIVSCIVIIFLHFRHYHHRHCCQYLFTKFAITITTCHAIRAMGAMSLKK